MAKLRGKRKCSKNVSRRALWSLIGLTAVTCLPAITVVVLISRTTVPDLFDLVPKAPASDEYELLAWPSLERARRALSVNTIANGARLRALGYMMERDRPLRDGDRVGVFVLLPDVGNALHPAHRFGDQMIEVRLGHGVTAPFHERTLVWVFGTLRSMPGDPAGHEPLYRLEDAQVESANEADISKYFR
jgi:hypothetical protein